MQQFRRAKSYLRSHSKRNSIFNIDITKFSNEDSIHDAERSPATKVITISSPPLQQERSAPLLCTEDTGLNYQAFPGHSLSYDSPSVFIHTDDANGLYDLLFCRINEI
eukprot:GHVR01139073.1.p1 GENE.GHVR01139073.1~~GHVR01139073.1.p1  ORF type:complete len:123 (+),score=4.70 GHVR01139073.1:46-369(+)